MVLKDHYNRITFFSVCHRFHCSCCGWQWPCQNSSTGLQGQRSRQKHKSGFSQPEPQMFLKGFSARRGGNNNNLERVSGPILYMCIYIYCW